MLLTGSAELTSRAPPTDSYTPVAEGNDLTNRGQGAGMYGSLIALAAPLLSARANGLATFLD